VKAPLFPAYKTAAVGFSLCARCRRRVGARRSYFVPTISFPSPQRPNPCLPTPLKSRHAAPLLSRPRARRRRAPGGYRPVVPRSTHASSPYPPIEPPNRTLVVHRTLPTIPRPESTDPWPEFHRNRRCTAPRDHIAKLEFFSRASLQKRN
jgi:hypothetical protein